MKQIINGKLYDTEKCKFIAAFVLQIYILHCMEMSRRDNQCLH